VRTTGEKIPDSARSKRVVYRSKKSIFVFMCSAELAGDNPCLLCGIPDQPVDTIHHFQLQRDIPEEGFCRAIKTLSVAIQKP
jgi:hypothetical protein